MFKLLDVKPVSGSLGAIVSGVELSKPVAEATFAEIHKAILKYQVIFFQNQSINPGQYLEFAKLFGHIADYPFANGMDDYPEIVEIIKEPDQTSNFGGMWHTDTAYMYEPPNYTLLYAVETPPVGGDTIFSNMYLAYDNLSKGMKYIISCLSGVNSSALHKGTLRGDHLSSGSMQKKNSDAHTAVHPAIRTHPETSRKALYVNSSHTAEFAELTHSESAPILAYLFSLATKPEFTCRFQWTQGCLAIWDNRCTQHCAINDYDGYRRVMQRITISGERPE